MKDTAAPRGVQDGLERGPAGAYHARTARPVQLRGNIAKGYCPYLPEPSDNDKRISDTELVRRHLAGDTEAFGALVRRYRKELFAFLARFVSDPTLAEDIFQETFLQLHISGVMFDQDRRLKPWLFTIAANKARDAMRTRRRKQAAPLDAALGGQDQRTSYVDLMPADVPPPDEKALNLEMRRSVQRIVNEMPDSLRIVLILSYFNELPYKEIAEILEVPLGTVKSRLHAAVKHFAKQWKQQVERKAEEG